MFRSVPAHVWAFDLEWVPDLGSGRRAYNLPPDTPDAQVYETMWAAAREAAAKYGGNQAAEESRPYLKTMLCRVVSVAAVVRRVTPSAAGHDDGRVTVSLWSLPGGAEPLPERELVGRFLRGIGESNPRPQLVGFNSRESDVPILIQRGLAQGVSAPGFSRRPDKPWDGYDYFNKSSEGHIDLKEVVGGGRGVAMPKLHEFACACGIPGKIDVGGDNVIDLWLAGDLRRIVDYNETDALTTYLLWLRAAHFAGHFTAEAHAAEVERVRDLLRRRAADGQAHLARYLARWEEMNGNYE